MFDYIEITLLTIITENSINNGDKRRRTQRQSKKSTGGESQELFSSRAS